MRKSLQGARASQHSCHDHPASGLPAAGRALPWQRKPTGALKNWQAPLGVQGIKTSNPDSQALQMSLNALITTTGTAPPWHQAGAAYSVQKHTNTDIPTSHWFTLAGLLHAFKE